MPLIIHASQAFVKRFKVNLSLPEESVPQIGRLDSWSVHFYRISRTPMVMLMNDATLWAIIVPAKGLTTLGAILPIFLERIAETWHAHGAAFDPANQTVLFFPRRNRSLIGSMNDAILHTHIVTQHTDDLEGSPDWREEEKSLNQVPYKALNFSHPAKRMAQYLGEE